jgi:fructokinase
MIFGGIELGGTKTVAAIGLGEDTTLIESITLATTSPDELIREIATFFDAKRAVHGAICGIGVGAFGPVVINRKAKDYGYLLETNKPGWSGFGLVPALEKAIGSPIILSTDVAAAGIGEARFGALKDVELGVYLTIGTGIGGAVLHYGIPLPGLLHPEIGHLAVRRAAQDEAPSTCRFHSDCAEGLAAGPAIASRFGNKLCAFESYGPEIALIADYLGQLCASLALTLSPQRMILGGGVLQTDGLTVRIEQAMWHHLNGCLTASGDHVPSLQLPALGQNAGIIGTLAMVAQTSQLGPAFARQ